MKKYWKLLFFLVMVLLSAGYVWQVPSERNTLAILIRHQSQMEDFVQSVKAEATHPHDVLSAPDLAQYAMPEGTQYASVYTDDSIFPDQLVGRLLEWDLYTPDDCQPLPKEFQKRWQSLRRGRFTDFSCDVAKDGTFQPNFIGRDAGRNMLMAIIGCVTLLSGRTRTILTRRNLSGSP